MDVVEAAVEAVKGDIIGHTSGGGLPGACIDVYPSLFHFVVFGDALDYHLFTLGRADHFKYYDLGFFC